MQLWVGVELSKPFHNLRIHIYVQHLLGSGHEVRMRTLAAALAAAGHQVTLICGGVPSPHRADGYERLQLPPVKVAADDFSTLLQQDNSPLSEAFKQHRVQQLLRRVRQDAPQILIVETFPFGRRALRFELFPLLQLVFSMVPRPLTFCSVRDILQLRSAQREQQTLTAVKQWFDYVLVHADSTVVTLDETFSLAAQLNNKVFHSGYLHSAREWPRKNGSEVCAVNQQNVPCRAPIVVSSGGGAVGFKLLQSAIAAKRYSCMQDRIWHILVGPNLSPSQFHELKKHADSRVKVQRNRTDFTKLLAACAVSVSQAGYNTVLDAVHANCRSVLVPFARYGETEQAYRAEKISQLGRAVVLQENNLTPEYLAESVERAAGLDLTHCRALNLDGAAATTEFIEHCFAHKQAS